MLRQMKMTDESSIGCSCREDPTPEESEAMMAIVTCMEKIERVSSWTNGGKEILRGLMSVLKSALHRRPCPKE
jgi:hypothetical protein